MKLAVISAVHNEEKCIDIFLERLKKTLLQIEGLSDWNIIFVNDGSTDNSYEIIRKAQQRDSRIKLISLSRNFGYQAALLAGLSEVEAELYAIIDVDCEDPPELLKTFLEKIKEGNHLVYGIRSQRHEPALLYLSRKLFYRLNKMIADSEVIMWMAEFSMFSKPIRDAILKPKTTFYCLRTEMARVGFCRCGVDYVRQNRVSGQSHYNISRMTKFAIAAILAGTTFPLRLILYLSFIFFLIFVFCIVLSRDLTSISEWTVIFSFFYLLVVAPILGLYLARTYKDIVARPAYIIDPQRTFL